MTQQKPDSSVSKVTMNLEVHVIPVSDVERSKEFYLRLGWRLDEDVAAAKNIRIVQFTPPGSSCSVNFGAGITPSAPGTSVAALVVSDIKAAHEEVTRRGIAASDMWHGAPFPLEARLPGPGSEAHQLRLVLRLRRSGRERVARPRNHITKARAHLIHTHIVCARSKLRRLEPRTEALDESRPSTHPEGK